MKFPMGTETESTPLPGVATDGGGAGGIFFARKTNPTPTSVAATSVLATAAHAMRFACASASSSSKRAFHVRHEYPPNPMANSPAIPAAINHVISPSTRNVEISKYRYIEMSLLSSLALSLKHFGRELSDLLKIREFLPELLSPQRRSAHLCLTVLSFVKPNFPRLKQPSGANETPVKPS
jgi:hypothetical protein